MQIFYTPPVTVTVVLSAVSFADTDMNIIWVAEKPT